MKKSEIVVGQSYWYNASNSDWQRSGQEARLVGLTPTEPTRWGQSQSKSLVTVEVLRRDYVSEGSMSWKMMNVPCSHLRGDYAVLKKQAEETSVRDKEHRAQIEVENAAKKENYDDVYLPKFNEMNKLLERSGAPSLHASSFGSSYSSSSRIPEETLDVLIDALRTKLGAS
jgi:hypothetical protein